MVKPCFQHDMAYGQYKDLEKRSQSDKVLKDRAFVIAKNPKYDGYQRGLASMVHHTFLTRNQLLENSSKENSVLLLKTIFGVLI